MTITVESLIELSKHKGWSVKLSKGLNYKEELSFLIEKTNFLPENATLPNRMWHLKHSFYELMICPECKTTPLKFNSSASDYKALCTKCSRKKGWEKSKATVLERYGVTNLSQSEEIKKRKEEVMQERYGVSNPFQLDDVKEKIKDHNLQKYGVEYFAQTGDFKEKFEQTSMEKYGVKNPMLSENIIEKRNNTNLKKYGHINAFGSPKIQNKIKYTNIKLYNREHHNQRNIPEESLELLNDVDALKTLHHDEQNTLSKIEEMLDVSYGTVGRYLTKHGLEIKQFFSSSGEREIAEFLQENGITIETRNRKAVGHELDVFIPDHNLAIEFNGIFWHSEGNGKDRQYHRNKYLACRQHGIRLLQILETEWNEKQDLVKEKILNILGKSTKEKVYARKTKVVEVDTEIKSEFFDRNHIQGNGPSSINYGLTHNNELVAVLAFIKQKDNYVLNRYATSKNVVGGFTKLLKHFEREYNSPKIITFADLRWSEGDLYYNTGFVCNKELAPDYSWTKGNQVWHKFSWRHIAMKQKLENYDPNLSEVQNMHKHGYYRLWDCGKLRFVKNLT